jgi:hypothetical protein
MATKIELEKANKELRVGLEEALIFNKHILTAKEKEIKKEIKKESNSTHTIPVSIAVILYFILIVLMSGACFYLRVRGL